MLNGWAAPELLASYETERLPVARVLVQQMAHNLDAVPGSPGVNATDSASSLPQQRSKLGNMFGAHNLIFGMTYDSKVIVPDGTALFQVANPITDYVPCARPGSRAPHVWVERADKRISTLDLFAREFVLLTGERGSDWCEAVKTVSGSFGVPIQAYRIGASSDLADPGHAWATTFGVKEDGAVIVRPDGYVAWRSGTLKAEPGMEIELALQTALAYQNIKQHQAG